MRRGGPSSGTGIGVAIFRENSDRLLTGNRAVQDRRHPSAEGTRSRLLHLRRYVQNAVIPPKVRRGSWVRNRRSPWANQVHVDTRGDSRVGQSECSCLKLPRECISQLGRLGHYALWRLHITHVPWQPPPP